VIEIVADLAEDPRPSLRRAADHQRVGAGVVEHAPRALGRVDVAVGDDRYRHRRLHRPYGVVVDRAGVAAGARAAVHASARIPASSAIRAMRTALRRPASHPVRILSVTGTSTARTTAATIAATSASSRSSAEPAATLQTFFAGSPC